MKDRRRTIAYWAVAIFVFLVGEEKNQISAEDQCIWYGECGLNSNNGLKLNCPYSGPPKRLEDEESLQILRNLCPDLVNSKGDTLTCCDKEQLKTFSTGNMKIAQNFIGKCPACWYNFRKYYCEMTCGPKQSQFLHPLKIEKLPDESKELKDSLTSVQFYVKQSFADELYKSCANIEVGGMSVMGIMCGSYGKEQCSGTNWLDSMGTNPLAPVNLQVKVTTKSIISEHGKTFEALNLPTIPCNMPVEANGSVCACSDCFEACNSEVRSFELPEPFSARFSVQGVDGMTIIAVLVYFVLSAAFLLALFYKSKWKFCGKLPTFRQSATNGILQRQGSFRESSRTASSSEMQKERVPLQETSGGKERKIGRLANQVLILQPIGTWFEEFAVKFEDRVETLFVKFGIFCAKRPFTVLFCGLLFSGSLSFGLLYFTVVTDPIELWAMPQSRARLEREYYDSHFEPFFRTEQVIISPTVAGSFSYKNKTYSNVFKREFLHEVLSLQMKIEAITAKVRDRNITLHDICYTPMAPENRNCTVFSLINYFQNKDLLFHKQFDHLEHIRKCLRSPTDVTCLGSYGGPVFPFLALGGFDDKRYFEAKVVVLTFIVNNYYDKSRIVNALAWEEKFIEFMNKYNNSNLKADYIAARSIQDEFERETHSDIATIAISYLIMFLYISIGLGQANSFRRLFIDSKLTLGLSGIFIVLLSVMSSVGIFSYLGIPATLIVVEVVPFMVLAVGVDNIFILVQAYQRDIRQPNESREQQLGRVVGDVAPSMLLSSITDASGFFLGAISPMPAVRTFALYAGTALIIVFILHITCFVSVFSLDIKRQESFRLDLCCCVRGSKKDALNPRAGLMYKLFKNVYAPFLMKPIVRVIVILVFLFWLCTSLAVINKVEVGLEQELSMPKESYVMRYLASIKKYLAVGPPMHFVIKAGYDYTTLKGQNAICKGPTCEKDSILNQISFAQLNSERTYLAQEALSWIDDYTSWITQGACCRINKTTQEFCPSFNDDCSVCDVNITITKGKIKRVVGEDFKRYLPFYLKDNPTFHGCLGGHATYGGAVELSKNGSIGATSFMTFHTILKTSKDYYEALWWARYISDKLTEYLNRKVAGKGQHFEVFPYSLYYVFYEQYLTMWRDTMLNLLYSSICIFIMAFFLLGMDVHLSLIIVTTICMIVLNLMGIMYWWNIQLNAVSLVNLVVAIGIAVEFCSHITRAFAVSTAETKILRTKESLINMGSSVLSGITLTKFAGIMVLAFAKSQIFQVFYFRINLCIVLFGAAHGLIFLPVLLSYFGPSISKRKLRLQQQQALLKDNLTNESESNS